LVPTLDNPRTVRNVVMAIRRHLPAVILVDDGSGEAGRAACDLIAADGLATLRRLDRNRGKGAAVKAGFAAARELGFTHAFQIDADGQHDIASIPTFLRASAEQPDALILGYPRYDGVIPRGRRIGRRFTNLWVDLEVGRRGAIRDAMIGFRVYPLAAALASGTRANRMDFDIEIAVRMVRNGCPVQNLPVDVQYLAAGDGGVSHFRLIRDNLGFCRLHSRLCIIGMFGWLRVVLGGRR